VACKPGKGLHPPAPFSEGLRPPRATLVLSMRCGVEVAPITLAHPRLCPPTSKKSTLQKVLRANSSAQTLNFEKNTKAKCTKHAYHTTHACTRSIRHTPRPRFCQREGSCGRGWHVSWHVSAISIPPSTFLTLARARGTHVHALARTPRVEE